MPRHLPRTDSTAFRIVWAVALLAWAGFAFAAPRGTQGMPDASAAAPVATAPADDGCDGVRMTNAMPRPAPARRDPSAPRGCCHGSCCHCLPAVGALLPSLAAVPVSAPMPAAPALAGGHAVPSLSPAPPLRPPIA